MQSLLPTMLFLGLGGAFALVGLLLECSPHRARRRFAPDPMRGVRVLGLLLCAALLFGLLLCCLLTLAS